MGMEAILGRLLIEPSPDDLWQLHPHLLVLDDDAAEPSRELARLFFCYLSCMRSKLTSKQFSSVAALLAAGSIGVIALEDIIEALSRDRQQALHNLVSGGLAGALEVLSTTQHVKAWETEFASVHDEVVWQLYEAFWNLSAEFQPDLAPSERHMHIDSLLSVVRDSAVNSTARMVLVIRLFQILLAIRLAPFLRRQPSPPAE
jgi:hypothetical protein